MPKQATGAYTSDKRLYLDAAGKVVGEDSSERVTLLVGVGGKLPRARALELGLIDESGKVKSKAIKPVVEPGDEPAADEAEAKHVAAPAETKHVAGPMAKADEAKPAPHAAPKGGK